MANFSELSSPKIMCFGLRIKLSVSDAEIAKFKHRNTEFLKANKEYNKRCDTKVKKLEQKNAELEARLVIVEQSLW